MFQKNKRISFLSFNIPFEYVIYLKALFEEENTTQRAASGVGLKYFLALTNF